MLTHIQPNRSCLLSLSLFPKHFAYFCFISSAHIFFVILVSGQVRPSTQADKTNWQCVFGCVLSSFLRFKVLSSNTQWRTISSAAFLLFCNFFSTYFFHKYYLSQRDKFRMKCVGFFFSFKWIFLSRPRKQHANKKDIQLFFSSERIRVFYCIPFSIVHFRITSS